MSSRDLRCAVFRLAAWVSVPADHGLVRGPLEETEQGLVVEHRGVIVMRGASVIERHRLIHDRLAGAGRINRAEVVAPALIGPTENLLPDLTVAAIASSPLVADELFDGTPTEIGHLGSGLGLVRLRFQAFPDLAQESDPAQGAGQAALLFGFGLQGDGVQTVAKGVEPHR